MRRHKRLTFATDGTINVSVSGEAQAIVAEGGCEEGALLDFDKLAAAARGRVPVPPCRALKAAPAASTATASM